MKRNAASVLILALWALFTLGALALAVGEVVSAQIRLARYLKENAMARHLARAGISQALAEIRRNPTNAIVDESLFLDNPSLEGGTFSVYFTTVTNLDTRPHFVTNYGVASLWESWRINIDSATESNRLAQVLGNPTLAGNILTFPTNSVYESVQQLLAVPGVDYATFSMLEPLVTLSRYRFRTFEGNRYRRASYGGVAVGRVLPPGGSGAGSASMTRRIAFVYDVDQTNYLHWREY